MGNVFSWFGMVLALAAMNGCTAGRLPEPPPPPPPPPTVVDMDAPVIAENLPVETVSEVAAEPAAEPAELGGAETAADETATPDEEEGTQDPFNSESVDSNREGQYILERALMMPKADPPASD